LIGVVDLRCRCHESIMVESGYERGKLLEDGTGVFERSGVYREEEAVREGSGRDERAILAREIDGAAVEELLRRAHVLALGAERELLALHDLHEIEPRRQEERDDDNAERDDAEPQTEGSAHSLAVRERESRRARRDDVLDLRGSDEPDRARVGRI